MLAKDFGIPSDMYSVTELLASCGARRSRPSAGTGCIPASARRTPYVEQALREANGPVHRRHRLHECVADLIREWVPGRFVTLGTDGFGRWTARAALRKHFEVDAKNIVVRRAARARRGRRASTRAR